MSQISEETMKLANELMHAYRRHTVDLMTNLMGAVDKLKIAITDPEGNHHDIVLVEDVVGMLDTVRTSLSQYDVEEVSESLDSDG